MARRRVRLYGSVVQLTPQAQTFDIMRNRHRKITGHIISFLHNGAESFNTVAGQINDESFPRVKDVNRYVKVVFLGLDKARKDIQIGRLQFQPELCVNFDKVIAWLQMLKQTHPAYHDIQIDDSPERRKAAEALPGQLAQDTYVVGDDAMVRLHERTQVLTTPHRTLVPERVCQHTSFASQTIVARKYSPDARVCVRVFVACIEWDIRTTRRTCAKRACQKKMW